MTVTGGMISANVMSASTSQIASLKEGGNEVLPILIFSRYLSSLRVDRFFQTSRTMANITNEIRIPLTLPIKYMYNFSLFPAERKMKTLLFSFLCIALSKTFLFYYIPLWVELKIPSPGRCCMALLLLSLYFVRPLTCGNGANDSGLSSTFGWSISSSKENSCASGLSSYFSNSTLLGTVSKIRPIRYKHYARVEDAYSNTLGIRTASVNHF